MSSEAPERMVIEPRYLVDRAGNAREGLAILIDEGKITAVDRVGDLATIEARRIVAPTSVALPGLVNAHHHGRATSTLAGGLQDASLEEWVVGLLGMPGSDPYDETMALCGKLARSGITTSLHVHSTIATSADEYDLELRKVLNAYKEAGIRCVVSADLRDQGLPVYADEEGYFARLPRETAAAVRATLPPSPPIDDALEVIAGLRGEAQAGRFGDATVIPGPVAHLWCSDELLAAVARFVAAAGCPLQTHLLQTTYDRELERRRFGHGTLHEFARIGLLSDRLSVAHAALVDDEEVSLLANAGATVVVNPSSCLRVLSAIAPIRKLLAAGVNVALGTDNMGLAGREDVLEEARLLQGLARFGTPDTPTLPWREILPFATRNGGIAIGRPDVGVLEVGAVGDIVLVDLDSLGPVTRSVAPLDAVFGLASGSRDVHTVVAAGRLLVENGRSRIRDVRPRYKEPTDAIRLLVPRLVGVAHAHYREWMARR